MFLKETAIGDGDPRKAVKAGGILTCQPVELTGVGLHCSWLTILDSSVENENRIFSGADRRRLGSTRPHLA